MDFDGNFSDSDFSVSSLGNETDCQDDDNADIEKLDAFFAKIEAEKSPSKPSRPSPPTRPSLGFTQDKSLALGAFQSSTKPNSEVRRQVLSHVLDPGLESNGFTNDSDNRASLKLDLNPYGAQNTSWSEDEPDDVSDSEISKNNLPVDAKDRPKLTHHSEPNGGVCNREDVDTLRSNSHEQYLKHLLHLNDVSQASLKRIEDQLSSRLHLTRYYKDVLVRKIYAESEQSMNDLKEHHKFIVCRKIKLTIPYFKDKDKFPAPLNTDVKLKIAQNEYQNFYQKPLKWSDNDSAIIRAAIRESEIEAIIENKKRERASLVRHIKNCDYGTGNNKRKVQLEIALQEHVVPDAKDITLHNMSLEELIGNRKREYDWQKISALHLDGDHSPIECQMYWENILHPKINKSEWTKKEEFKLKSMFIEMKDLDWDMISRTLNTGRTSLQCAQRCLALVANAHIDHVWFTKAEDKLLKKVVKTASSGNKRINWTLVAQHFPLRSRYQLRKRWKYVLDPAIKKSKFSHAEDVLLLSLVRKHGKRFQLFKSKFPGRMMTQLKLRYQQLTLDVTCGNWTREDDDMLYRLAKKYGETKWTMISRHFEKRCPNQCRSRYLLLKRKLQEQWEKEGVQDLSKLDVPTRDLSNKSLKAKKVLSRRQRAALKLIESSSRPPAKSGKLAVRDREVQAVVLNTKPKRVRKSKSKVNVEKLASIENFSRFKEHFAICYRRRGEWCKYHDATVPPEEITDFAEHLWLILGSLAANLTKIPKDNNEILDNDSLDNITKKLLIHFKENNVILEMSTENVITRPTKPVSCAFNVVNYEQSIQPPSNIPITIHTLNESTLGSDQTSLNSENLDPAILPPQTSDINESNGKLSGNVVLKFDRFKNGPLTKTYEKRKGTALHSVNKNKKTKLDQQKTSTDSSIIMDLEVPVVTAGSDITYSSVISSEVIPIGLACDYSDFPTCNNISDDLSTSTERDENTKSSNTFESICEKNVSKLFTPPCASGGTRPTPADMELIGSVNGCVEDPLRVKIQVMRTYGKKAGLSKNTKSMVQTTPATETITTQPPCIAEVTTTATLTSETITTQPTCIAEVTTTARKQDNPLSCVPVSSETLTLGLPLPKSAVLMAKLTDGKIDEIHHLPSRSKNKKPRNSNALFPLKRTPAEKNAQAIIYLHNAKEKNGSNKDPSKLPLGELLIEKTVCESGNKLCEIKRIFPPSLSLLIGMRTILKSRELLWKFANPVDRYVIVKEQVDTRKKKSKKKSKKDKRDELILPENLPGEALWQQRFESLFWLPAMMSARLGTAGPSYFSSNSCNPFRVLEDTAEIEYNKTYNNTFDLSDESDIVESEDEDGNLDNDGYDSSAAMKKVNETLLEWRLGLRAARAAEKDLPDPGDEEVPSTSSKEVPVKRKRIKHLPKKQWFKGKRVRRRRKRPFDEDKDEEEEEKPKRKYVRSGKFAITPTMYGRASARISTTTKRTS